MTLKELEDILRPQFVWSKSERHKECNHIPYRWRVQEYGNGLNDLAGLIVFCGCAWVLGFKDRDVFDYLEIKRRSHIGLLSKFKQALKEHQVAQISIIFEQASDINKVIIIKTTLVMNLIKARSADKYVNLLDFDF